MWALPSGWSAKPFRGPTASCFSILGKGGGQKFPAGSDHPPGLDISRVSREGVVYARSVEFSDFPARYDATGPIAGHRRWVRVRAVQGVLAAVGTNCNRAKHPGETQMKADAGVRVHPHGDPAAADATVIATQNHLSIAVP